MNKRGFALVIGEIMQFKYSVLRILLAGLSVGAFVLPARGWEDNTSAMVTYFPVPYASYNNLYVKDKFDVGTYNGDFTLNLGNSGVSCASNRSLDVHEMHLRKVTIQSSLKVNQDLFTDKAFFGNKDSSSGSINLSFGNVRIGDDLGSYSTPINSFDARELYTGSFYLYPDRISDSNLSNATCADAKWRYIDFGSNHKGYFITCCVAAGDCEDCYYDTTVTNTYKPRCENHAPQGTWIQGNKPAGKTCGCNCPATVSQLDADGYCQCKADYTLVGNTCVLSCSLSDYRGGHKNDCCRRSPWYTDYTDSVCWNLKWKSISGGLRQKAGSTGSCTSGSWNVPDPNNTACSTPNQELTRVRDIGPCSSDPSQCCEEYHLLKCQNTINWN